MPDLRDRTSHADMIKRLRDKLVETFERAGDVAGRAATTGRSAEHLVKFLVALLHQRNRLAHAMTTMIEARSAEDQQRVLREAELALLRDPARFIEAQNQLGLLRAWTELLFDATERVERDEGYARLFAKAAAEKTDEDREFVRGTTRVAARRWRDQ